ncbi:hypothetical protein QBC46DRAFT_357359 [Diplogelasinospora grovesii]|uniref:Uncharacterized protein n=1 Tax=Diplogelasinospora grovesii TaxID=303347 RepID=A0AAN6MZT3_9PEZI|nr:hypothetical protein QBC46DRAFT_357359 [Diplogelasinospora grovesii]
MNGASLPNSPRPKPKNRRSSSSYDSGVSMRTADSDSPPTGNNISDVGCGPANEDNKHVVDDAHQTIDQTASDPCMTAVSAQSSPHFTWARKATDCEDFDENTDKNPRHMYLPARQSEKGQSSTRTPPRSVRLLKDTKEAQLPPPASGSPSITEQQAERLSRYPEALKNKGLRTRNNKALELDFWLEPDDLCLPGNISLADIYSEEPNEAGHAIETNNKSGAEPESNGKSYLGPMQDGVVIATEINDNTRLGPEEDENGFETEEESCVEPDEDDVICFPEISKSRLKPKEEDAAIGTNSNLGPKPSAAPRHQAAINQDSARKTSTDLSLGNTAILRVSPKTTSDVRGFGELIRELVFAFGDICSETLRIAFLCCSSNLRVFQHMLYTNLELVKRLIWIWISFLSKLFSIAFTLCRASALSLGLAIALAIAVQVQSIVGTWIPLLQNKLLAGPLQGEEPRRIRLIGGVTDTRPTEASGMQRSKAMKGASGADGNLARPLSI